MNFLSFFENERKADELSITGDRAHHLIEVLKVSVGDPVKAVQIGTGERVQLRVSEICGDQVGLKIQSSTAGIKKLPIHLILALPRPKVLRRIVYSCFQLGVAKMTVFHCFRVEKSYWSSDLVEPESLFQYQRKAMEMTGDASPIEIHYERRFKPFVEDRLAPLAEKEPVWIADATGSEHFPAEWPSQQSPAPSEASQDSGVHLVVGPEGGFIDYERELLKKAGGKMVCLGPRVLSSDVAAQALVAAAAAAFNRFSDS